MPHTRLCICPSGSGPFEVESAVVVRDPQIPVGAPQPAAVVPRPPVYYIPQNRDGYVTLPSSDNSSTNTIEGGSVNEEIIQETAYLPLKLASDLVPSFDGKTANLTKFLKQCKLANTRVKPADQKNLLAIIRSKIEGHADQLISNRPEPNNINELISLLKNSFSRFFDVDRVYDELRSLTQSTNEGVEYFGARVMEVLNRGIEAAREKYDQQQSVGVQVLLKNSAVTCFTRGLKNQLLSTLISKEKLSSLETAIDTAVRIEIETTERERHLQIPLKTGNARVFTTTGHQHEETRRVVNQPPRRDRENDKDYGRESDRGRDNRYYQNRYSNNQNRYHQSNHHGNQERNREYRDRGNQYYTRNNNTRRDTARNYQSRDYKRDGNDTKQETYNHLNRMGAPLEKAQRSEVLVARAKHIEPATTSGAGECATSQRLT